MKSEKKVVEEAGMARTTSERSGWGRVGGGGAGQGSGSLIAT